MFSSKDIVMNLSSRLPKTERFRYEQVLSYSVIAFQELNSNFGM